MQLERMQQWYMSGICTHTVCIIVYLAQKPDISCCICSKRDRLGFYADADSRLGRICFIKNVLPVPDRKNYVGLVKLTHYLYSHDTPFAVLTIICLAH